MNSAKKRTLGIILLVLSLIGVGLTVYLTYQHFKVDESAFCNFNDYLNCDIVNKSEYSEFAGIPVSIMGMVAYVVFFIYSIGLLKSARWAQRSTGLMTVFGGVSLLISLVLTYIEFFVLYAVCIFCLSQQFVILFIFLLLLSLWRAHRLSHS